MDLTVEASGGAEIDIEVTGPLGFAAAAGGPPLGFRVREVGSHFVLVRSVSTWRGSYEILLTNAVGSPPPPSTTTPPNGLQRSLFGEDAIGARDELLGAGFAPRLIEVCSSSVGAGFVRQIVEEQFAEDEISELVIDDADGLTDAGRTISSGSNVVVKVSTGNACGTANWIVVVGADSELVDALDELRRTVGTEFEGRTHILSARVL